MFDNFKPKSYCPQLHECDNCPHRCENCIKNIANKFEKELIEELKEKLLIEQYKS